MQNKTNNNSNKPTQNEGGSNNNKRRNNRRKSTKKPNQNGQGPNNNQRNQSASGNRPTSQNNNQTRRPKNKRRKKKYSTPLTLHERVYRKYDHLIEVHSHARKKYFEMYFRADPRQKEKLYNNFVRSLEEFHKFENTLTDEEKDVYRARYKRQELDTTYTENHSISPVGEEVNLSSKFPDPHYLKSQQEADYSSDQEETSGSIEDYKAYKGL